MKVALIVEWMDASRGGAETSTIQFVKHLVDLGVEVEVFTRSERTAHLPCRATTVPVNTKRRSVATSLFCRNADRAVLTSEPDLIHALVPSMVADIYQPRGGTYPETKLRNVATRRGRFGRFIKEVMLAYNPKQMTMERFEQLTLARPNGTRPNGAHAIALSDYVVRQFREHYDVPPERITKIFNGVDPLEFDEPTRIAKRNAIRQQFEIEDSQCLVLMAANNLRLKGAGSWIRALAELKDHATPIRSIIVGNGHCKLWQKLARRCSVSDRLVFAGHTDDIAAYYHAADMLVHPTYYDPCSRVVLEAKSIGLPCITTRYDGAAEVIEDGVDGYVLESPDDVGSLALAVRKTVEAISSGTMRRMRPSKLKGITMREHAEQVIGLYEQLLTARTK